MNEYSLIKLGIGAVGKWVGLLCSGVLLSGGFCSGDLAVYCPGISGRGTVRGLRYAAVDGL